MAPRPTTTRRRTPQPRRAPRIIVESKQPLLRMVAGVEVIDISAQNIRPTPGAN